MSWPAFLSSAAGAFTVMACWYGAIWWLRRRRPQPRPDQAICYKCRLIGGRNLILEAGEATDHLRAHVEIFPGTSVSISAKWARHEVTQ